MDYCKSMPSGRCQPPVKISMPSGRCQPLAMPSGCLPQPKWERAASSRLPCKTAHPGWWTKWDALKFAAFKIKIILNEKCTRHAVDKFVQQKSHGSCSCGEDFVREMRMMRCSSSDEQSWSHLFCRWWMIGYTYVASADCCSSRAGSERDKLLAMCSQNIPIWG